MDHDWLLVETLGDEPAVVAQGSRTKNLVPISTYHRRNPHLMAIQSAIGETVRGGQPLTSITSKHDRVIRTDVVRMSDGVIHGVQLWIGPPDIDAPERPMIGPLKWDLDSGVATDTPESLTISGRDASREATHGRAFAEDLPARALNPDESRVLSMVVRAKPGHVMCSTWNVTDYQGRPIAVGFVARAVLEAQDDGTERLICRSMNWRAEREEPSVRPDDLAQRILNGLAVPGVHRAVVDLNSWRLLKWLDEPCPFYDWRAGEADAPMLDPDDEHQILSMAQEFAVGPTARVLGLRAHGGGYTPIHVTATRVELDENTIAALLALRLPTDEELAAAEQGAVVADEPDHGSRPSLKSLLRLGHSAQSHD
ncbi:PAS domain-containing protein [Mycobacterium sp. BMJ-28]